MHAPPSLPAEAQRLADELGAPPRLVAHLRLVHDAARRLLDALVRRFPAVPIDRNAVLFGAATHDVGKVSFPGELHGPGRAHEAAGEALLLNAGVPPYLARFARTHGAWDDRGAAPEDLVVALADKVWKGGREGALETRITEWIAEAAGIPAWEAWVWLDEVASRIAAGAGARLEWQRGESDVV